MTPALCCAVGALCLLATRWHTWAAASAQVPPGPSSVAVRPRLLQRALARTSQQRTHRSIEAALPDVLDRLARAVRSGMSLRQALQQVGPTLQPPIAHDVQRLNEALERGQELSEVLARWAHIRPVAGVSLAATALKVAQQVGGSSARAIDGVAETLRESQRLRSEVEGLASQARASAALIAFLPLVFAMAAGATDPRTLQFLVGTPLGLGCLATALALDGLGVWWMRRIVSGVIV